MVILSKASLSKCVFIIALFNLVSACTEFPAFPDIPIQGDMAVIDAMLDMEIIEDMQIVDMDMMLEADMDMLLEADMDMLLEADMDMMPIEMPDMMLDSNFTETVCNASLHIEGSERRIINGEIQTGEPLPCQLVGERFLRVDPVNDVLLSAEYPNNPSIDDGVTSATTNYTYFFMAREVTFKQYESVCTATERPEDAATRINQATCFAPTYLSSFVPANKVDDCSIQKQPIFDASADGMMSLGEEQADLPMNCVDWESATNFCRQIGGRLPSEAEWEIATTYGRSLFPTPWPDSIEDTQVCQYANVAYPDTDSCQSSNPTYIDETGNEQYFQVRPTCWGENNPNSEVNPIICDAVGNVSEWTLDDYVASFPTEPSTGSPYLINAQNLNACPGTAVNKVTKGGDAETGSIQQQEPIIRLFGRKGESCDDEIIGPYIGFRCVISDQNHGVPSWTAE